LVPPNGKFVVVTDDDPGIATQWDVKPVVNELVCTCKTQPR